MRRAVSSFPFPPPYPIASGSGGSPRVSNPLQQPAGLRLEPGLGHWGRSPHIGFACALLFTGREGRATAANGLSTHPASCRQLCPPRPASQGRWMPSLLYCHFLAVGSRQWQSKQQCLAGEPPTVSLKPHTPWALMPACLPLHLKSKNVFRCPVLILCHLPLGTIVLFSSKGCWVSAKSPASRN